MKFAMLRKYLLAPALLFSVAAQAMPIAVTNPSFEDSLAPIPPGFSNNVAPVGWTAFGFAGGFQFGVFNPGSTAGSFGTDFVSGVDGDQTAYSNSADFSQVLAATLMADTTYALTVAVGDRSDTVLPSHTIRLLAGGVEIAALSDFGVAGTEGAWTDGTATSSVFAAGDGLIGSTLSIELINDGGAQVNWDNVRLEARMDSTQSVPTPTPLLLLGLGLAALGLRKHFAA